MGTIPTATHSPVTCAKVLANSATNNPLYAQAVSPQSPALNISIIILATLPAPSELSLVASAAYYAVPQPTVQAAVAPVPTVLPALVVSTLISQYLAPVLPAVPSVEPIQLLMLLTSSAYLPVLTT